MASSDKKDNTSYTNFDEILKRGAATEPKNFRPVPQVMSANGAKEDIDLSLNGALQSANGWNINALVKNSATEPKRKINRRKKNSKNDESGFSSDGSQSQSRKRTPMTMPRTKVTSATPLEQ